ncbi:hypothetical protein PUN28_017297 [Cardiocondyla obscurior]|uniref:Uncharacterized protein n=1 Tax=Cardiocondyla obscurior TaxID=286306 RepID=A0AAW2ES14_9HYME
MIAIRSQSAWRTLFIRFERILRRWPLHLRLMARNQATRRDRENSPELREYLTLRQHGAKVLLVTHKRRDYRDRVSSLFDRIRFHVSLAGIMRSAKSASLRRARLLTTSRIIVRGGGADRSVESKLGEGINYAARDARYRPNLAVATRRNDLPQIAKRRACGWSH